jgi:hypothetical protein
MRRTLGMATATVLAIVAGSAMADEVTGTVQNIDLTSMTFDLEGKTFTASPTDTMGVKLDELKEGDKVTVEASDIETGKQPINAMSIKKAE